MRWRFARRAGSKQSRCCSMRSDDDKRVGWGAVPGVDLHLNPIPDRWIEDAKDRTIERLTSFLAGEIRADPTERDQCRWCDYAAACRYEERTQVVIVEGAGG